MQNSTSLQDNSSKRKTSHAVTSTLESYDRKSVLQSITISSHDDSDCFVSQLEAELQKCISKLADCIVIVTHRQVSYLYECLHAALQAKLDPESLLTQSWTILPQADLESDRPRRNGKEHLNVLRISTMLREIKCLQLNGSDADSSQTEVEINIFPSLEYLEIRSVPVLCLRQVTYFSKSLHYLYVEGIDVIQLKQLLCANEERNQGPSDWSLLKVLSVRSCCELDAIDQSIDLLKNVTIIDLGWNRIKSFACPLKCCSLLSLQLCHNKLSKLPDMTMLKNLEVLDVSMNKLHSVDGVQVLSALKILILSWNNLSKMVEIGLISTLTSLQHLSLKENPLARRPDYRREILYYVGACVQLDDEHWTPFEIENMPTKRSPQMLGHNETLWAPNLKTAEMASRYGKLLSAQSVNKSVRRIAIIKDMTQGTDSSHIHSNSAQPKYGIHREHDSIKLSTVDSFFKAWNYNKKAEKDPYLDTESRRLISEATDSLPLQHCVQHEDADQPYCEVELYNVNVVVDRSTCMSDDESFSVDAIKSTILLQPAHISEVITTSTSHRLIVRRELSQLVSVCVVVSTGDEQVNPSVHFLIMQFLGSSQSEKSQSLKYELESTTDLGTALNHCLAFLYAAKGQRKLAYAHCMMCESLSIFLDDATDTEFCRIIPLHACASCFSSNIRQISSDIMAEELAQYHVRIAKPVVKSRHLSHTAKSTEDDSIETSILRIDVQRYDKDSRKIKCSARVSMGMGIEHDAI